MSSAKFLLYRPYNQYANQITLLCDGKDHCKYRINVAKPVCGSQMKPTTLTAQKQYKSTEQPLSMYLVILAPLGFDSGESVHIRISQEWFTFEVWIDLVKVFYKKKCIEFKFGITEDVWFKI